MTHNFRNYTGGLLLLLATQAVGDTGEHAVETTLEKPTPTLGVGARVFQARCVLCHGNNGMGEGTLPLSMRDYPSTNLLQPRFKTDTESLLNIVIWGGTRGSMNVLSPPWGDELSWTEIESVVMFVEHLRENTSQALVLLAQQVGELKPSIRSGRQLFNSRCTLCHGEHGTGNGKMARIIKNPPPFNLTKSRMPDEYLMQIIGEGGEALARSPQMPPWKGELTETQIKSLVMYIKTLRE